MLNLNRPPVELRIEILRHWRKPFYHLAPHIGIHPATLSGMLTGRIAMPISVKKRILEVLEEQRHAS